ncbi:MAG TPA: ABC transporter permease [Chthoniobacterales bacterium]|jgi:predicted permease
MISELRFAGRSLLKRPGFTFVAIITLALGIGASSAIFSVVDAVLLRPLPYPRQERIVELRELDENGRGMPVADPNFDDLQRQSRSFEAIARYNAGPDAVAGGNEPVRTIACAASADFFRVLGVKPFLGRLFSSAGENQVAVVSYGFWKRSLGGRSNLEGTTLRLEGHSFAVVGVLPSGVEFPPDVSVWFPASIYPRTPSRTAHNWSVVARLRAGASMAQARAEVAAIGQQLKREFGNQTDAASFGLTPLRERMVKNVRGLLWVLCGAVGLLLVIACSNVANLLLVRATTRRKEIALRAALGASRWQLTRQFLAETLLLTLVAGTLGVLFANWGVSLIVGLYHGNLPRIGAIGVDTTVLIFALAVSLAVGLLLGLVPSLHISNRHLQTDLQESGRGSAGGASSSRIRNGLIVAQVALTLMLLVGAGLLGRSFQRLLEVSPGFQPESTVAMTISQADPHTPAEQRRLAQFYERLLDHLRELPGAIGAGGINALPMSGDGANGSFIIETGGETAKTDEELSKEFSALAGTPRLRDAEFRVASEGYFSTMHIPLVRGRFFASSDGPDSPQVALVSQALVRRYWPNEDPIGKEIQYGNMDGDRRLLHVVGVVGDVRDDSLDAEPRPTVYVDFFQRPRAASQFSIVLRSKGDPASLIASMRREARALDPEMPTEFQTLEQVVSSSLDNRRFSMVMLGVFAGAALLLAMVGLYGIMAYITSQRTREIGIRMALGAQRGDMLRLILRQSFALVAVGVAAGIFGALAGTRLLRSLLYGVSVNDLATYLVVVLLLGAAALVASLLPARRATKVDPVEALRAE